MIKKTITYLDLFTEEKRTNDYYFNLSKAEVLEYMAEDDDIVELLRRIIEAPSAKAVLKQLKLLVGMSYGIRTVDGDFLKDENATKKFLSSEAYSELLEELIKDEEKSAAFVIGIIPPEYREEAKKAHKDPNIAKLNPKPATEVKTPTPEVTFPEASPAPAKPKGLEHLSDEDIQKLVAQAVANQNTAPTV